MIEKPLNEVVSLFDSVENLYKWLDGLQEFTHISGTPGTAGAKSRMVMINNGRKLDMEETLISNNLPKEYLAEYKAKGLYNRVKYSFQAQGEHRTLFISEQYFSFSGVMRFISWIFPRVFKNNTLQHMRSFQRFAESVK